MRPKSISCTGPGNSIHRCDKSYAEHIQHAWEEAHTMPNMSSPSVNVVRKRTDMKHALSMFHECLASDYPMFKLCLPALPVHQHTLA